MLGICTVTHQATDGKVQTRHKQDTQSYENKQTKTTIINSTSDLCDLTNSVVDRNDDDDRRFTLQWVQICQSVGKALFRFYPE